MLLPADAAVVRRDPAIAGLATLLDAPAFAAALQRARPQLRIVGARCRDVRYKPGLVCQACYDLETEGGPLLVVADAYAPSRRNKVDRALAAASPGGPFGTSRLLLEDCAILIRLFPDDPELPALAASASGLLPNLLPDHPDLARAAPNLLRYKPQRRYVARLEGSAGSALLKLYCAEGFASALNGIRGFRPTASLRLATPIAVSTDDRAIVLRWVDGSSLRALMAHQPFDRERLLAAGRALAAVHGQAPAALPALTRTVQSGIATGLARSLSALLPELATRIDAVTRELVRRLSALPERRFALHGDFDTSQVIVGTDAVTLIDFDRAQRGDPATDLGNFLACLEYDVLHDRLAGDLLPALLDALTAGYAETMTNVPDPACIRLDAAFSLLKIAQHPFRQRHESWDRMTERIIDRIEGLLAAAPTHRSRSPAPEPVHGAAACPLPDDHSP